jgi:predicted RecA/RadA family phage recombinase
MNGLKYQGDVIQYAASSAKSANDVVQIGDLIGIVVDDIAASATGSVRISGVVQVTKASGAAWTAGATVYYDSGSDNFTTTASGNTRAGCAELAAGSSDTTGYIILNAAAGADIGTQSAHIADPAATASDPTLDASDITDNSGGTDPGDHTIAVVTAPGTISETFTANDPSFSADGAVTIADGSTPTVAELLEFCQELNAKVTAINTAVGAIKNAVALIAAEYNSLKDDTEALETSLEAAIDDVQANNAAIDSTLAALEAFKVVASS